VDIGKPSSKSQTNLGNKMPDGRKAPLNDARHPGRTDLKQPRQPVELAAIA
jgi:hypothetical protein